jgi:hypothetical protein
MADFPSVQKGGGRKRVSAHAESQPYAHGITSNDYLLG